MRTGSRVDLGLLVIRIGLGATMFAHGSQKLFGGSEGTVSKAPRLEWNTWVIGPRASAQRPQASERPAAERSSGSACATPLGGAAVAATMASAAAVHAPAGFFATEGGMEYQVGLAIAGAALAISGPGRYSLDEALGQRLNRPWMVVAALAGVSAIAAAIQAQRQKRLVNTASAEQPSTVGDIDKKPGPPIIRITNVQGRGGRRCRTASAK